MSYGVVWFKKDLRLFDHEPLARAAAVGPILALHVVEPSLWRQPDMATQHYLYVQECLRDLFDALRGRGLVLQVVLGEAVEVLEALHRRAPFKQLWSHEETGTIATWQRDKAVLAWCRHRQVTWTELPTGGVVRRLLDRDRWHGIWEERMTRTPLPLPDLVPGGPGLRMERLPSPWTLGLRGDDPPDRQRGGRNLAMKTLRDFLEERSRGYRGGISSPLTAPTACSRLSPYLAHGCLGLREVVQTVRALRKDLPAGATRRRRGLEAFESRLHWQSHFIQKLESEPEIEVANMHRGYDGLRETAHDEARFEALISGKTGWPMVDACVAMLRQTGWLNFRMRAMLVSVAAYPLWLHWRPVGLWLARQFLDYEPGIHWSQMQMQSGTTGINTPRIYNPIKQASDHDPDGAFVRHWLPALRKLPDTWLAQPWLLPYDLQERHEFHVGRDWPAPLVEIVSATREAKARLFARRGDPEVRAAKQAVLNRHGSRLSPQGKARAAARRRPPARLANAAEASGPSLPEQLGLGLEP
ncbi:MAG: FAD-binding domain-containing protein [Candidatus Sericytochromatia bacterium]|nr:FAD-binding domain-containing protein [Candidatus Sericytochromatia bacterium]